MNLIGHNNGPTMESGTAWRRPCWARARVDLLPTLPLEVVRRAQEIGLDLRRAADNLPSSRFEKLDAMQRCDRKLAAYPPMDTDRTLTGLAQMGLVFRHGFAGPRVTESWSGMRDRLQRVGRLPAARRRGADGPRHRA